ncbi:PREDICTED: poly(A)-specific ribonuclease PARN-like isoform X2 [Eufriesea mexicana]|uniref:poly(A)-specific ribonuclease PARN-like isoform X2 n=1 Tax=Eufriesea mexicana TaxID=516756 RepID=UPI00083C6E61|nr:PREDICTED: poly(A)-specific ribonuclease PARN-like isoform X2 [Eufriesea mexicana]XP_017755531.1 PREDICTED: poly(A)-specific ribonuclease PARN-like isoform X2 [Eufriesea mexicana]
MEVTSSNFQEVLEELDVILKNATFLGIDGEFTGLNLIDVNVFDTPTEYYTKLRKSMDFLLIEFGLSVFTFDTETQKYSQRSYNFYVFPRPLNRTAPNHKFLCEASSIAFLAAVGFDFNKLFKLGIPYLNVNEGKEMLEHVQEKHKTKDESSVILFIPISDRPQIEEICARISKFIKSEEKELVIKRCNTFIRRLVCQEIKLRWPNTFRIDTEFSNAGCRITIQKLGTKEAEMEKDAEKMKKDMTDVKQAVGLSILMKKLANSGKLIVGHNMLLDLCHIIHQFFGDLPESYLEFKSLVHSLFPRLLDTKVLCQSEKLKDIVKSSNLTVLLETVCKSPFEIMEVESIGGINYSISEEKYHEAGYDAYVTGICFIALSNYLGSLETPKVSIVLADSPVLAPFLNKLCVARLKDVPYINLVSYDIKPNRDHVFHLTFPKEWKSNDIYQLFKPLGSVYIAWLNDTSAYVQLHRRDQLQMAMRIVGKRKTYEIRTYADYQASLKSNVNKEDSKETLSSPEIQRNLSSCNSEFQGESFDATNRVRGVKEVRERLRLA